MAKAAPVPNFPAKMLTGTGPNHSKAFANQRRAAETAAIENAKVMPLLGPSLSAMQLPEPCPKVSEIEDIIEFVKMSPGMYFKKKFSK